MFSRPSVLRSTRLRYGSLALPRLKSCLVACGAVRLQQQQRVVGHFETRHSSCDRCLVDRDQKFLSNSLYDLTLTTRFLPDIRSGRMALFDTTELRDEPLGVARQLEDFLCLPRAPAARYQHLTTTVNARGCYGWYSTSESDGSSCLRGRSHVERRERQRRLDGAESLRAIAMLRRVFFPPHMCRFRSRLLASGQPVRWGWLLQQKCNSSIG